MYGPGFGLVRHCLDLGRGVGVVDLGLEEVLGLVDVAGVLDAGRVVDQVAQLVDAVFTWSSCRPTAAL